MVKKNNPIQGFLNFIRDNMPFRSIASWHLDSLYNLNYYLFYFLVFLIYLLTILSLLKISISAPLYLNQITFYIRFYVCLFLLIRFNPIYNFGGEEFTELDKKVAFSAALAILSSQTEFIISIKNIIASYRQKL